MKFDTNNLEENLEKSLEQLLAGENPDPLKTEMPEVPLSETKEEKMPEEPMQQDVEVQEASAEQQVPQGVPEDPEAHLSMEEKIDLAMKKIMVDTIGELPEEEPEIKKKKKERKKRNRKNLRKKAAGNSKRQRHSAVCC